MKEKLLCIVQLPPPVHGASLMNSSFVNSPLINERYALKVIDIATAKTIEDIGRFSLQKISGSIASLFRIAGTLFSFKPRLVYFTFSPSGFAFYRDAVFIFLIKAFHRELVIHLHGKGIDAAAKNSRLRRWISRHVFANANIIFLSETLTRDLTLFPYKKKFIVNCGIPSVAPIGDPARAAAKPRLLFLSNYVRSKGIIDLVDAVELVASTTRDFDLHLVGKPYDIGLEELNQYIDSKGLGSIITACGPKYEEEKFLELQQADLFVFPTYYSNEAFPLVLLEAMQWGLPSISTREGGIPDIIDEGVTGLLIDQRDIRGLAEKILFLLRHPEERAAMGSAARKIFVEKFTLTTFEKNMGQTLENILEG